MQPLVDAPPPAFTHAKNETGMSLPPSVHGIRRTVSFPSPFVIAIVSFFSLGGFSTIPTTTTTKAFANFFGQPLRL